MPDSPDSSGPGGFVFRSLRGPAMIGKTVALIQVPNQALFSLRAAARYLGLDPDTLRADTDAGQIPCYEFHGRRTYKLEDLEELRAQLVRWENRPHPKAAAPRREI